MKQLFLTFMLWLLTTGAMTAQHLNSPNGNFALQFRTDRTGKTPVYSLNYIKEKALSKKAGWVFHSVPRFEFWTPNFQLSEPSLMKPIPLGNLS